jgi:hypothetical protein
VQVTKAGTLAVHGPRAARCDQRGVDHASPSFEMVDSLAVRATSPAGHRLGAVWVAAGGKWTVMRSEVFLRGYRPRVVEVDDLRAALRAAAAAPGVEQDAMVDRAVPYTEGADE